jgi:hypothetical protein
MSAEKANRNKTNPQNKWLKGALSHFNRNRRLSVLAIVIFASFGVGSLLLANAAQIKDENTVILSNGQEIRLNESIRHVSRKLGDDLVQLNDYQYEYPALGQQVEVIIDVDRNRVVAIHLADSANSTLESNNTVGIDLSEVTRRHPKSQKARGKVAELFPENVVIERSRAKEYVLADTCQNPNIASAVSIALKGYEERVSQQWNTGECFID